MARRDIPTDVIGTSHLVREYTNLNFEECFPINEVITKTVGSNGRDFATLQEALTWTQERVISAGAVHLVLDDGTHILDYADFDYNEWTYFAFGTTSISIESSSGNKANCKITMGAGPAPGDIPSLITLRRNGYLHISNITLDMGVGGFALGATEGDIFYLYENSTVLAYNCDFVGRQMMCCGGRSYVWVRGGTMTAAEKAFGLYEDSIAEAVLHSGAPLTIAAATIGIEVIQGAKFRYGSSGAVAFGGGVTTNTNVPINQIQYLGAVIANGAAALSFKP